MPDLPISQLPAGNTVELDFLFVQVDTNFAQTQKITFESMVRHSRLYNPTLNFLVTSGFQVVDGVGDFGRQQKCWIANGPLNLNINKSGPNPSGNYTKGWMFMCTTEAGQQANLSWDPIYTVDGVPGGADDLIITEKQTLMFVYTDTNAWTSYELHPRKSFQDLYDNSPTAEINAVTGKGFKLISDATDPEAAIVNPLMTATEFENDVTQDKGASAYLTDEDRVAVKIDATTDKRVAWLSETWSQTKSVGQQLQASDNYTVFVATAFDSDFTLPPYDPLLFPVGWMAMFTSETQNNSDAQLFYASPWSVNGQGTQTIELSSEDSGEMAFLQYLGDGEFLYSKLHAHRTYQSLYNRSPTAETFMSTGKPFRLTSNPSQAEAALVNPVMTDNNFQNTASSLTGMTAYASDLDHIRVKTSVGYETLAYYTDILPSILSGGKVIAPEDNGTILISNQANAQFDFPAYDPLLFPVGFKFFISAGDSGFSALLSHGDPWSINGDVPAPAINQLVAEEFEFVMVQYVGGTDWVLNRLHGWRSFQQLYTRGFNSEIDLETGKPFKLTTDQANPEGAVVNPVMTEDNFDNDISAEKGMTAYVQDGFYNDHIHVKTSFTTSKVLAYTTDGFVQVLSPGKILEPQDENSIFISTAPNATFTLPSPTSTTFQVGFTILVLAGSGANNAIISYDAPWIVNGQTPITTQSIPAAEEYEATQFQYIGGNEWIFNRLHGWRTFQELYERSETAAEISLTNGKPFTLTTDTLSPEGSTPWPLMNQTDLEINISGNQGQTGFVPSVNVEGESFGGRIGVKDSSDPSSTQYIAWLRDLDHTVVELSADRDVTRQDDRVLFYIAVDGVSLNLVDPDNYEPGFNFSCVAGPGVNATLTWTASFRINGNFGPLSQALEPYSRVDVAKIDDAPIDEWILNTLNDLPNTPNAFIVNSDVGVATTYADLTYVALNNQLRLASNISIPAGNLSPTVIGTENGTLQPLAARPLSLGGRNATLGGSFNVAIGADGPLITGEKCVIIGSDGSQAQGTVPTLRSVIIGGNNNSVTGSSDSLIASSTDVSIIGSNNTVVGANTVGIQNAASVSCFAAGATSSTLEGDHCVLIGSTGSSIDVGSEFSHALGANNCQLGDSKYSAIVGSLNSSFGGQTTRSVIEHCQNVTMTGSTDCTAMTSEDITFAASASRATVMGSNDVSVGGSNSFIASLSGTGNIVTPSESTVLSSENVVITNVLSKSNTVIGGKQINLSDSVQGVVMASLAVTASGTRTMHLAGTSNTTGVGSVESGTMFSSVCDISGEHSVALGADNSSIGTNTQRCLVLAAVSATIGNNVGNSAVMASSTVNIADNVNVSSVHSSRNVDVLAGQRNMVLSSDDCKITTGSFATIINSDGCTLNVAPLGANNTIIGSLNVAYSTNALRSIAISSKDSTLVGTDNVMIASSNGAMEGGENFIFAGDSNDIKGNKNGVIASDSITFPDGSENIAISSEFVSGTGNNFCTYLGANTAVATNCSEVIVAASNNSTITGDRLVILGSQDSTMATAGTNDSVIISSQVTSLDGSESAVIASDNSTIASNKTTIIGSSFVTSSVNTQRNLALGAEASVFGAGANGSVMIRARTSTIEGNDCFDIAGESNLVTGAGSSESGLIACNSSSVEGNRCTAFASEQATIANSDRSTILNSLTCAIGTGNNGAEIFGSEASTIDQDNTRVGIFNSFSSSIGVGTTGSEIMGSDDCKIEDNVNRATVLNSISCRITDGCDAVDILASQGCVVEAGVGNAQRAVLIGCDDTVVAGGAGNILMNCRNTTVTDANNSFVHGAATNITHSNTLILSDGSLITATQADNTATIQYNGGIYMQANNEFIVRTDKFVHAGELIELGDVNDVVSAAWSPKTSVSCRAAAAVRIGDLLRQSSTPFYLTPVLTSDPQNIPVVGVALSAATNAGDIIEVQGVEVLTLRADAGSTFAPGDPCEHSDLNAADNGAVKNGSNAGVLAASCQNAAPNSLFKAWSVMSEIK